MPVDELGLLLRRRAQQLRQQPAQPRPQPRGPISLQQPAGPEADHDARGGLVCIGVLECLDAGLVDGIAGDTDATVDELAHRRDVPRPEVGGSRRRGSHHVGQAEVTGAAGVGRVVAHEVPRHAIRQPLGRDEQVDRRVVQRPVAGLRTELLADQRMEAGGVVHRAGHDPPQGGEERNAAEDLRCALEVQADEPMRRDAGGDAGGQHGTGRGSGHEVERLTRGSPGLQLQIREQDRRDDPADAAAIDGEDASHGTSVGRHRDSPRSRIRGARAGSEPRRRAHPLLARQEPAFRSPPRRSRQPALPRRQARWPR